MRVLSFKLGSWVVGVTDHKMPLDLEPCIFDHLICTNS